MGRAGLAALAGTGDRRTAQQQPFRSGSTLRSST